MYYTALDEAKWAQMQFSAIVNIVFFMKLEGPEAPGFYYKNSEQRSNHDFFTFMYPYYALYNGRQR